MFDIVLHMSMEDRKSVNNLGDVHQDIRVVQSLYEEKLSEKDKIIKELQNKNRDE